MRFTYDWEYDIMKRERLEEADLLKKETAYEKWIHSIMMKLTTDKDATVVFYPYRTARVGDSIFDLDRESATPIECILALKAAVTPDNHTAYAVNIEGEKIYFYCSDNLFRVGKKIEKL